MSSKPPPLTRLPSNPQLPGRRKPVSRLASLGLASSRNVSMSRRASVTGLTSGPKSQRSSKTTHKLVELPSAPQTRPLLAEYEEDLTLGHETDAGVREYKSQAERMTKEQRKQAGFKRITAYCIAESFKMKLLSSFLKREHNVSPRAFDEALYVVRFCPRYSCLISLNNFLIFRCTIYHFYQGTLPTPMFAPQPLKRPRQESHLRPTSLKWKRMDTKAHISHLNPKGHRVPQGKDTYQAHPSKHASRER